MEISQFWKCISILLKNYHAVNRKVFACKTKNVHKIHDGIAAITAEQSENCDEDDILNINGLEISISSEQELLETLKNCDYIDECEGYVISLKFLTKTDDDSIDAVAVIDFMNSQYTCTFQSTAFDDFRVVFGEDDLEVNSLTNRRKEAEPNRWADFVLKPKLVKWANSAERKDNAFDSLRLIDVEIYNGLYKKLKAKYSKDLLAIWEENTDPLKFVYEDLAIAAYLICLWKEHHCAPKAFADLGCGNGLLVYILNQEGYRGCGYDVRSRKIWSLYPKATLLFEETIVPNRFQLPHEVDWIIGNHSDELSPWIPVMAVSASKKMKYFLLPCCPFEFSGMKFQRRNSKQSSYTDFLDYVEMISKKCGFLTLRDRLKIPSTKRIAIIGIARTYAEASHPHICSGIKEFLATEIQENPMKLRVTHEAVRNCTQIDSDILDGLTKKIFLLLLGPEDEENAFAWNEGSKRTIKEIAEYLSQEDLKSIKSECGGLKTLLKNKHEIFEFTSGNVIQIRRPKVRDLNNTKPITIKKRLCFFATNHPNGCPLTDEECTFIHPDIAYLSLRKEGAQHRKNKVRDPNNVTPEPIEKLTIPMDAHINECTFIFP